MSREFVALAIMGIDQHENGAIAVARVLREAQMKVAYLGKFHSPASVAEKAIKEDAADVVWNQAGMLLWNTCVWFLQLVEELRTRGSDIPVVIGGSGHYRGGRREDAAGGRGRRLSPMRPTARQLSSGIRGS